MILHSPLQGGNTQLTCWHRASTEPAVPTASVSRLKVLHILTRGLQEPSAVSLWLSISVLNLVIEHPDNMVNCEDHCDCYNLIWGSLNNHENQNHLNKLLLPGEMSS